MASFGEEHSIISEKMSDLVVEYASRFVAQEYLEAYEKAKSSCAEEFVPSVFDEVIYKKISKKIKKRTGYHFRIFRMVVLAVLAVLFVFFAAFTFTALLNI